MKKSLCLILTIILAVVLLSGLTATALDPFEKPLECSEAEAAVVVTHTSEPTAKYYFDDLTQEVIDWSCQRLKGEKTVTLLKDLDVSVPAGTKESVFTFRTNDSYWYESKAAQNGIIFNLGDKTITCHGDANLFGMHRFSVTIKNGTIDYINTGDVDRGVVYYGTANGNTGTSAGGTWAPVLEMEDLVVYNRSEKSSSVLRNFIHTLKVEAFNCTFWSKSGPALYSCKSDQTKLSKESWKRYEGDFTPSFNLESCILISNSNYAVQGAEAGATVSLLNSLLVDAAEPKAFDSKLTINDNGNPVEKNDAWTGTLPDGTVVAGKATIYGEDPFNPPLLFLDVPLDAWYYTFVQELYNAKIIAGMDEFTFAPDGTLTYGQALKLITLGIGEAEQAPVAGGNWASGYVAFAKTKGWLAADVDPNAPITRLAFCQIAAKAKGLTDKAENKFTDCDDASVLALVKAGVINGMTETTFAPNNQLTRAQISKIISLLRKL